MLVQVRIITDNSLKVSPQRLHLGCKGTRSEYPVEKLNGILIGATTNTIRKEQANKPVPKDVIPWEERSTAYIAF